MFSLNHATLLNASHRGPGRSPGISCSRGWRFNASSLILLSLLVLILPNFGRGDDLTGLAQDDPKDLLPLSATATSSQPTGAVAFLPLPGWAHLVNMPPLPDQLKPL